MSFFMRLGSGLLGRFLPPYLINQLRFEWYVWRNTRGAASQTAVYAHKKQLYVNAGAGGHGRPGWINMDAYPNNGINFLWDFRKGLPFDPGSVKGFFSEHLLEHLDYQTEVTRFLRDAFAALQSGGTIRLIVPDAGKYLAAYMAEGWSELVHTRPLLDGNIDTFSNRRFDTKMELVNEVFRQGGEHKFAWDFETMRLALRRAGFVDIEQQTFNVGSDTNLLIDSPRRAAESLYVEARKP